MGFHPDQGALGLEAGLADGVVGHPGGEFQAQTVAFGERAAAMQQQRGNDFGVGTARGGQSQVVAASVGALAR